VSYYLATGVTEEEHREQSLELLRRGVATSQRTLVWTAATSLLILIAFLHRTMKER